MNIPGKLAHQFARSDYVTALSLIVSFISFGVVMRDILAGTTPKIGSIIGLVVALLFFAAVNIYSLKVRNDNQILEEIAKYFREINTNYREALFTSFWGEKETPSLDDRLLAEKNTLKAVCQIIARIFTKLLYGKECTVTVKLLTKEDDGISYATTYARNHESSERDVDDHWKYEVNTGKNSGLDQALKNSPAGKLSYFHSADLSKETEYSNQRSDYLNWYKSTIVVPIRCPLRRGEREAQNYGFLTIDTMTRHRLNNGHHVVMLSSLAEQMFNFMALMRGDYRISAETKQ
ncbi:hypothetical protein [Ectothiorhodospira variabilis]|uniref:hypothetical protein n=1 Tax=Ectothiorhodospira variabilis TaxID=505694 RepID=UPI001EFBDCC6|nr:hypothetical protein [Ectothiorhodospira variabilis]MCG5498409.1 hypothetical protein [Ectothiorhodospira variabilis]